MTPSALSAVSCYAHRFHVGLSGHHVASPVGAWLILALAAPATSGERRSRLEDILGLPAEEAAAAASELLGDPHPAVGSAVACWSDPQVRECLARWLESLPASASTGPIPSQAEADRWADEHTSGLIDTFPIEMTPETVLVLASALATKVRWKHTFRALPAEDAMTTGWGPLLDTVLAAPPAHVAYLADHHIAGKVAVHAATSADGLIVVSTIAAADVPHEAVLAAAHDNADTLAAGHPGRALSLFDLPTGAGPAWTITETAAQVQDPSGLEERVDSFLPAWTATSTHDLTDDRYGFADAAGGLISHLPPNADGYNFAAAQSATASFSREGFEAAAVTAMGIMRGFSLPRTRDGLRRVAHVAFSHPYAVVAVASQPQPAQPGRSWHGIPVFSAWVAKPSRSAE